jgi:glycosyltransferase involved in cell wall biosynthesis
MAPRFSILLPTHDRSNLLRLAISSVLPQTDGDFELLIVGDGCTDNSADVVASFDDTRIRWFDQPKAPNFGYANRNIALKEATGEYVAFVADDDLVFPDHLALLAANLESSGAEWVYSRPLWVTIDGLVVPFASNLLNSDELNVFLAVGNHIPATCVMYRRSCLDKYGYWPEEFPRAADWRYWIRIIEGGHRTNFACCPIPTALHFNAPWKTTPDTQMGQVTAAREIAARSSWWPPSLKVPIGNGMTEQTVFHELIRNEDYLERLRRDVVHVIERLAWMQLDETPGIHFRLREEVAQIRAELVQTQKATQNLLNAQEATQNLLNAMYASTSWRLTSPLRALGVWARRIGR